MQQREITEDYLKHFIACIQKGYPVTYVQESGALAVDDPALGYIVVQLKEKVVPNEV